MTLTAEHSLSSRMLYKDFKDTLSVLDPDDHKDLRRQLCDYELPFYERYKEEQRKIEIVKYELSMFKSVVQALDKVPQANLELKGKYEKMARDKEAQLARLQNV